MKNILLATDLAPETNRAFERAVKLASTLAAKLHILHVCPLYSFSKNKKQTISLKQDAEDMIKNSLVAHKGVKKLQTSITVIEGGETFAEIINHAQKVKAGLIVMGMHGKVKLRDMFVGTTIERVIRKGIRPVLMVRDKVQNDYKNIFWSARISQMDLNRPSRLPLSWLQRVIFILSTPTVLPKSISATIWRSMQKMP